MSVLIDFLWIDAAIFVVGVTGCLVYGTVSGLLEAKREMQKEKEERQKSEIEYVSDERLNEMYYGNAESDYPFWLVLAEKGRRDSAKAEMRRKLVGDTNESILELFGRGIITGGEARMVQANQTCNGNSNVSVIGSGNSVNCGADDCELEMQRFYADDKLYLISKIKAPNTYGTEERK